MKAMLLDRIAPVSDEPLRLVDLPDPRPGPGEILVRVQACGVCRTDLHVIEGDLPRHTLPIVPGHQVVGVVESRGAGADRFTTGERVGVAWLRGTCGSCGYCERGEENLCSASLYTGYHEHGGYAELCVVPEAFAYRIPDAFDPVQAAPLLCAGIIGYRALERANVPPGGRLALFGFGSSASVVIQIALHRGYQVDVVTRGDSHRDLARAMGAGWVGAPGELPPDEADGAIVFAPAGEIVPEALRAVRSGGTVAMAGIYMTPVPELDYETHLFHEKNLRSVEANTREDGRGLLREAAEVPVRARVTTFPLAAANEALLRLKNDRIDGSAVLVMD
ncbi:MAG: zinc-dependent alcohol dehydrogenase family protein [marine benthic group bacterium]|nr:zinc-dependent alcohol dehydrogenase family protein [Candidatus Benthicola marisminoris]